MSIKDIHQRAFQLAPDAIFVTRPDGAIVHCNDAAIALTGYSAAELETMHVESLVPTEARERHIRHRKQFDGSPWSRPMTLLPNLTLERKDGCTRPVRIELARIEVEEQPYVIASVRDDTDLRRLQDEVEEREAMFRDLFDDGPVPYLLVDMDSGLITRYNGAAQRLLAPEAAKLPATPLFQYFDQSPDDRERVLSVVERIRAANEIVGDEIVMRTGTSLNRRVAVYAKPVQVANDAIRSCRVALLDVTVEWDLRTQLQANVVRLEESLSRIHRLEGILGVCAWCRQVRDEVQEEWLPLESYLGRYTSVAVSHGICPSCSAKMGS